MYMYHATPMENLLDIQMDGISPSWDGMIYMCEKPRDAAKFIFIRGCKDILVCKCKIDDPKDIVETFDHDPVFFGCRAFGCTRSIPPEDIVDYQEFNCN